MDTVKPNRRTKKSKRSPRKVRRAYREEHGQLPEVRAVLHHLRMAPRKVRLIADQIRGKDVENAMMLLEFSPRSAARPMLTLLKSAVANVKNVNERPDDGNLFVYKVWVDEARMLQRFRPAPMGRAARIQKRMSHITIVLKEKE